MYFRGNQVSIKYSSFQNSGSSILPPNQMLTPGQFLLSPNGRFRLDLHGDGNLVIKDHGAIVWVADGNQPHSNTLLTKIKGAPWLVVSNSGFLYDPARKRLWVARSTDTRDKSYWYHSHMSIQDDGNLIIYDGRAGELRWARFGFDPGRSHGKNKRLKVLFQSPERTIYRFDLF
jgi:hypothetical protein